MRRRVLWAAMAALGFVLYALSELSRVDGRQPVEGFYLRSRDAE